MPGMMSSPGYKHCPLCGGGGGYPQQQLPHKVLLYLGEGHIKEMCSICKLFTKTTLVVRDLQLKQHRLEQTMRPHSALRHSSHWWIWHLSQEAEGSFFFIWNGEKGVP